MKCCQSLSRWIPVGMLTLPSNRRSETYRDRTDRPETSACKTSIRRWTPGWRLRLSNCKEVVNVLRFQPMIQYLLIVPLVFVCLQTRIDNSGETIQAISKTKLIEKSTTHELTNRRPAKILLKFDQRKLYLLEVVSKWNFPPKKKTDCPDSTKFSVETNFDHPNRRWLTDRNLWQTTHCRRALRWIQSPKC